MKILNGPNAKRAFLLLEVGIVLALIVIIVTLSIPHFSFMQRRMVRAEVDKLHMLYTYLQQKARVSGKHEQILFNVSDNSFVAEGYKHQLADGVMFGVLPGLKGPPSSPQRIIAHPVTFVDNTVTFYPDGTLQAGTLYLTDKERRYQVALTAPVAHISYLRKYYYDDTWHLL